MVDLRETAACVSLLRAARRPWGAYADLVEQAGSALAVLERERHGRSSAGQASLFEMPQEDDLQAIEAEILAWQADGIDVLTVLDHDYPENLRATHDRPPLVFVAGALAPRDARSIAVVGARVASRQGIRSARAIAAHLVSGDYTVVSGLAAGIDTAVHEAALARGGRTIAVIGTGLRRCYPAQNAALQRRIMAESAVLSQFWPDTPPSRHNFPMRNAVMSGFSLATVVVDASPSSGARIQARRALMHGRPVLLWHSLLRHEWAREFAQRPGTHIVDSPGEIIRVVEALSTSGVLVA